MKAFASLCFLAGLFHAALAADVQLYTLSDKLEAHLKETVAGGTRDPDAAKFQYIRAALTPTGIGVCGMINEKNMFGGYKGYELFVAAIVESKITYSIVRSDSEALKAKAFCTNIGVWPNSDPPEGANKTDRSKLIMDRILTQ